MCTDVMTANKDGLSRARPNRDRYSVSHHNTSSGQPSSSSGQQKPSHDETKVLTDYSHTRRKTKTGPHRVQHHLQGDRCRIDSAEVRSLILGLASNRSGEASVKKLSAIKRRRMVGIAREEDDNLSTTRTKITARRMQLNDKKNEKTKRILSSETIEMCQQSFNRVNWLAASLLIGLSLFAQLNQATRIENFDTSSLPIDELLARKDDDDDLLRRLPSSSRQENNRPAFNLRVGEQQQQRIGSPKPDGAESSPKFTRMNELDVFLDDMNHNELRAVATGKPIGDLFQARPLAAAAGAASQPTQPTHQDRLRNPLGDQAKSRGLNNSNSSPSSSSPSRLDVSQSEQQIYSECALILQRTYVKNIDNPK